ncbi:MAG TPA: tetratricopeptide repeat protein [bacterium]|nr:tetratricopeptide repeat protein [bacterium]
MRHQVSFSGLARLEMVQKSMRTGVFLLAFSSFYTFFLGCASERLHTMDSRIGHAERQMKEMIDKNEQKSQEHDRRVEIMQKQLEEENRLLQQQQQETLQSLDSLRMALSGEKPVVEPQDPPAQEPAQTAAVLSPNSDGSAAVMGTQGDARFQAAYADYARGSYDLAIEAFKMLRDSYSEGRDRARIEYYIAECYYGKQEYAQALTYFAAVGNFASDSALLAPALWKRAMCFHSLRLPARRTEILRDLIQRFPDSDEAGMAQEWLTGETP